MKLRLGFCSHEAAKFAVMKWHYSKRMPKSRLIKIGVWEDDQFIGVIIYGRGTNRNIGKRFNLEQTEICELVRVALRRHQTPVSKLLAISFKLVKQCSPKMRLIISFADPAQNHHGGVYQASNWIYDGTTNAARQWLINGKWTHQRTYCGLKKAGNLPDKLVSRRTVPKHRYLYPLDKKMRRAIIHLHQEYPKRLPDSVGCDVQS